MGIRVQCDWCRETIEAGTSYVTVQVDGKLAGEDIGGPASVFCAKGRESCAGRLIAFLEGNPGGRVDMGMEWQLVPLSGVAESESRGRNPGEKPPPQPVTADADLGEFLAMQAPSHRARVRRALSNAGVSSLDDVAALTDDELMEMPGIAWQTRCGLRRFIEARDEARAPVAGPLDDEPLWRTDMKVPYLRQELIEVGLKFPTTTADYSREIRTTLGCETVGDLRLAVEGGDLEDLNGVGPSTVRTIRHMLAALEEKGLVTA